MKFLNATAIAALAKIKGRNHVLDLVDRFVSTRIAIDRLGAVDVLVRESMNPQLESWFHVGVLSATLPVKDQLISRPELYRIAYHRMVGELDMVTAERCFEGLA